jgi:hypothetical protein
MSTFNMVLRAVRRPEWLLANWLISALKHPPAVCIIATCCVELLVHRLDDMACCALHFSLRHAVPCCAVQAIYDYFDQTQPGQYKHFDDMFPVVSCTANFDEILIPADHVSRSANDTYYVSADKVLRCHTSAHQAELLRTKQPAFLVTGALTLLVLES